MWLLSATVRSSKNGHLLGGGIGLGSFEVAGREISRRVLGEMSASWQEPWRMALEYQSAHPDVLTMALQAPDDVGRAALVMVPFFALMHPAVLRTAIAHCQAVADEFAVAPLMHTAVGEDEQAFVGDGDRDVDEATGGQQQDDRLAQLEARFDRLEAMLTELLAEDDGLELLRSALRDEQRDG